MYVEQWKALREEHGGQMEIRRAEVAVVGAAEGSVNSSYDSHDSCPRRTNPLGARCGSETSRPLVS